VKDGSYELAPSVKSSGFDTKFKERAIAPYLVLATKKRTKNKH